MTAERRQQVKSIFDRAVVCEPAAREELLQQVGSTDPDLRREVETLLASSTPPLAPKDREDLKRELGGAERATPGARSGAVEIAHVLFTDLVGYSLLPMDQQKDYLAQLQQIVRDSPRFRAAEASGEIISLPTGDGMALAFSGDPTAPVQCAIEVAVGLKSHPALKLRMGIHSGPVYRVADVNSNTNVAGGGINIAQRVMDCGDAGHILVSKNVADMLLQFSQWAPHLTDLGEISVKHGVKVHIYSLVTDEAGNREEPGKLKAARAIQRRSRSKMWMGTRVAAAAAVLLTIAAAALWFTRNRSSAKPAADEASIAVLPFTDMSEEKNQAYFSEGLAEELLDGLAKIPGLRVAARASSFQFKDGSSDFHAIGDKLKVASILHGSVRKQGNRARINVRLIKSADGFQMWSDSFDRDMTDILAVQQDISRAITGKLKLTMLNRNQAHSARSANAAAYEAYLQGRYFTARRTRDGFEKATAYYEQAVQLDPGYAPAWAGLGFSRANQAIQDYIPHEEGFQKAREAENRALALDPNLGEAHSGMAWIAMYHDWNWAAASASSERALALDPGSDRVINTAAILAFVLGRRQEGIALIRRATQIDPLSSTTFTNLGIALYYAGQYDEAEASLKKALELAPDKGTSHEILSLIHLARGQTREALAEAELEANPACRLFALALTHHTLGNKAEAAANLAKLISKFAGDVPCLIGEVYAYFGDKDRAFEWLERAYAERDPELTEIKGYPVLRNVEHDPRYAALLKKLGIP
jgi:TolB-like protein/class 3 adenylate cyclase/Tfp pilus assembly protein PilF